MEVQLSNLGLGLRQPNPSYSGSPKQNRQDDYRLRLVRKEHNNKELKLATVFETINMHSSRYHDTLERYRNILAKALNKGRPPRRLHRSPLTRARR